MNWFDLLIRRKPTTASVAKDRLQIIIARERRTLAGKGGGYLPKLQQELLEVISRYEGVDLDQVTVSVDKRGEGEVLELNITLPEGPADSPRPSARTPATELAGA